MKNNKAEQIIQYSITEFGAFGFENASTNRICENAAVSKGMIFHLFSNKQQLYCKVVERCLYDLINALDFNFLIVEFKSFVFETISQRLNFFMRNIEHYKIIKEATENYSHLIDDNLLSKYNTIVKNSEQIISIQCNKLKFKPSFSKEPFLRLLLNNLDILQQSYIDYASMADANIEILLKNFETDFNFVLNALMYGACEQ